MLVSWQIGCKRSDMHESFRWRLSGLRCFCGLGGDRSGGPDARSFGILAVFRCTKGGKIRSSSATDLQRIPLNPLEELQSFLP